MGNCFFRSTHCSKVSKPRDGLLPENKPYLKVVIVGDPEVGKTSLLEAFNGEELGTERVGQVDRITKKIIANNTECMLTCWVAGDLDKFPGTLTTTFYKGAHIILIAYDITRKQTYHNLKYDWLPKAERERRQPSRSPSL
jgi:Ras-related protein Rab-18